MPVPQPEEGRYAIEDLSARLPVDLTEAEQTLGMFTQNCIVVAEGELQADGVFKVRAPPGCLAVGWRTAGWRRRLAAAARRGGRASVPRCWAGA